MRLTRVRYAHTMLRTYRVGGLLRRLRYEFERYSGILARRTPVMTWGSVKQYRGRLGKFFVPNVSTSGYRALLEALGADPQLIVAEANRLLTVGVRYFSSDVRSKGFPPNWQQHPVTKKSFPTHAHWTLVPDHSQELGDIKLVWEPSRFTFAFDLVRAFALTGDERYAEAFWTALEDWCEANPPNAGPNWRCGQESSLRAIAWVFAWSALQSAKATTPARVAILASVLAFTAGRVEANLNYALSQHNNHGVSEAAGVWTVGLLLPDHPRSRRWQRLGRRILEELAQSQFSDDGGYIQQSVNYQRSVLQLYLWCQRLGEVNGSPLSTKALGRIALGAELLYQLQDVDTGCLPNYGATDGTLPFPLAQVLHEDHRATLQAVGYQGSRRLRYEKGPHDELVWWFYGNEILDATRQREAWKSLHAMESGYHALRGPKSFAFVRAATYKTRPGQADNLHVDIWHRGVNVAFDPGTYSYNSPLPWNNSLVHTRVHNTVTMDGADQMTRGGRFLWFDWVKSEVLHQLDGDSWEYLEVTHSAFRHLDPSVRHRRGLLRIEDTYVCIDTVSAEIEHDWNLNWNLYSAPDEWDPRLLLARFDEMDYRVQVISSSGQAQVKNASEGSTSGWRSTRYLNREPAAAIQGPARGREAWWVSIFGHESATLADRQLSVRTAENSWSAELTTRSGQHNLPLLSPKWR